jgi:hypothetical protein
MNQGDHWTATISKMPQVIHGHFASHDATANIPQSCLNLRRIGAMGGRGQPNGGFDTVEFEDTFNGSFPAVVAGSLAHIRKRQQHFIASTAAKVGTFTPAIHTIFPPNTRLFSTEKSPPAYSSTKANP